MSSTLTERIVNRLASGRFGSSRRSFLSGAAMVGTALATNPWQFVSRPQTAYATVCGEGAGCDEGWSAFCCTVSGANSCPPGSFVAGWWKADRSGFCNGTARYYVDCNAECGSDWTCHCGSGSCDQRRIACNQFRYGQCHQEIACYGPVVCRVVTCTPPWEFDPACTSTSLTDNRTITHSAPCLPGVNPTEMTKYWYDNGGPGGRFGAARSAERSGAPGTRYGSFVNAVIYSLPDGSFHTLTGAVRERFGQAGGYGGPLGFPTSSSRTVSGGRRVLFQGGAIYLSDAGRAHSISQTFWDKWSAIGTLDSGLGLPIGEKETNPDGSKRQKFAGGVIYWSSRYGAFFLRSTIYRKWGALGGAKGVLGMVAGDETSRRTADGTAFTSARFATGAVFSASATGTRAVTGAFYSRYRELGGTDGTLGLPAGDLVHTTAGKRHQNFAKGGLFHSPEAGWQTLTGVFWNKWLAVKGTTSGLGYPVGPRTNSGSGLVRINFQNGVMYHHASRGILYLTGQIFQEYRRLGGSGGSLGAPTSDPKRAGNVIRVTFQHGTLNWNTSTGKVTRS